MKFVGAWSARLRPITVPISSIYFWGSLGLAVIGAAIAKENFPYLPQRLPAVSLLEQLNGQKALAPQGQALRPVVRTGLALTEAAERFVGHLYNDAAQFCTVGYGRLIKKSPCNGTEPAKYRGAISKDLAEKWLLEDMSYAQVTVMTSVRAPLTDNQYAALCDFVFNVGANNFQKSTLLQVVNAKQFDRVPSQLGRWVIAGGKTWPGLIKRRKDEATLFASGVKGLRNVPIPGEDLSPIDITAGTGIL